MALVKKLGMTSSVIKHHLFLESELADLITSEIREIASIKKIYNYDNIDRKSLISSLTGNEEMGGIIMRDLPEKTRANYMALTLHYLKIIAQHKGIEGLSKIKSADKGELVDAILRGLSSINKAYKPIKIPLVKHFSKGPNVSMTLKILKEMARGLGVSGYSKYTSATKEDLVGLIKKSQGGFQPKSPAKRSPAKRSPAKRSPAKRSPAKRSPAKRSPAKRSPAKRSPVKKSFETMSLKDLKALAKYHGIRGFTTYHSGNKHILIKLIIQEENKKNKSMVVPKPKTALQKNLSKMTLTELQNIAKLMSIPKNRYTNYSKDNLIRLIEYIDKKNLADISEVDIDYDDEEEKKSR
jgi:hypothetical protein